MSLNTLLADSGPPDYVKMDVEGAERALLSTATEWARQTKSIKVELHGDYSPDACRDDLRALGFETSQVRQPLWPPDRGRPCIAGVRA